MTGTGHHALLNGDQIDQMLGDFEREAKAAEAAAAAYRKAHCDLWQARCRVYDEYGPDALTERCTSFRKVA
jgi:hypothetical protein